MDGPVITYPAGYPLTNDYVPLVGASTRNAKRSQVQILVVQLGIINIFDLEKHLVFGVVKREVWAHNTIRIYKPYEVSFLQQIMKYEIHSTEYGIAREILAFN